MSELLIGTAALLVAAPVVLAVARLALWPFLCVRAGAAPPPARHREDPDEQTGLVRQRAAGGRVHLIAREVQRVRWRREFDGWRIVQRQRIARRASW